MYLTLKYILTLSVTLIPLFDTCTTAPARRKIGEISKQKCREVYLHRYIPPEPEVWIIGGGGYDAKAKEYPHMAALGYGAWNNLKWACGGSLISENIVLTAAHCINTTIGPLTYVRLGDLNLQSYNDNADPQDFNVTRTIIHPDFNPPSAYNDIALVELDRPFERTREGDFIAPACLQTDRNITSGNWTAIGWGETSFRGPNAAHLQVMELSKAEHSVCDEAYSNSGKRRLLKGVDDDGQMCAGDGHIDTCQGDSGGPLQVKNAEYRTGYTVIGITSFGKPCILTKKPGVYTRVSHYIEWIESIVWPESNHNNTITTTATSIINLE